MVAPWIGCCVGQKKLDANEGRHSQENGDWALINIYKKEEQQLNLLLRLYFILFYGVIPISLILLK